MPRVLLDQRETRAQWEFQDFKEYMGFLDTLASQDPEVCLAWMAVMELLGVLVSQEQTDFPARRGNRVFLV